MNWILGIEEIYGTSPLSALAGKGKKKDFSVAVAVAAALTSVMLDGLFADQNFAHFLTRLAHSLLHPAREFSWCALVQSTHQWLTEDLGYRLSLADAPDELCDWFVKTQTQTSGRSTLLVPISK